MLNFNKCVLKLNFDTSAHYMPGCMREMQSRTPYTPPSHRSVTRLTSSPTSRWSSTLRPPGKGSTIGYKNSTSMWNSTCEIRHTGIVLKYSCLWLQTSPRCRHELRSDWAPVSCPRSCRGTCCSPPPPLAPSRGSTPLSTLHSRHQWTHLYSKVQYSTILYDIVQYSTVQHNTLRYSTVQYSTTQYSTI